MFTAEQIKEQLSKVRTGADFNLWTAFQLVGHQPMEKSAEQYLSCYLYL